MTKLIASLALAAGLSLAGGAALAACPDDMAATAGTDLNTTGAIAKDGSRAPLEGADQQAQADTVQKDGQSMPLESDANLATSQQDIEAQQEGEQTAAAQAMDDTCKD
jgi:hypothetical protein